MPALRQVMDWPGAWCRKGSALQGSKGSHRPGWSRADRVAWERGWRGHRKPGEDALPHVSAKRHRGFSWLDGKFFPLSEENRWRVRSGRASLRALMKSRRVFRLALATTFATAALACGQEKKAASTPAPAQKPAVQPGDIAATVNGDPITLGEVEQAFARAAASRGMPPDSLPPEQRPMVLRMLLDDMINEHLMNKACAGIKIEPDAVDAEFAKILKARGASEEDAAKELAAMGMTVAKIKGDIQKRMQQRTWVDEQIKGKAADATDADAKEFYEKNPQHFDQPEQVRASHILFRVEQGASPEVVTAAMKKAEGALSRAKKEEDFGKLAGELSEEPGAAERKGDLDFFPRKGVMVEPFAEAAFKLQKGEISPEPVRTDFGWHIIKVTDRKAGGKQPFDDAKPQILAYLGRERKRVAIDGVIADLRGKADVKILLQAPAGQMPAIPGAPAPGGK